MNANQIDLKLIRLMLLGGNEWASFLVAYLMTIMTTYLTGVWELSITHASQIMNVYSGTVVVLPVVMNLTLRCMRSLKFTIYVSKIAFVLGLVMLTISASGTCREDESLCIGTTKRVLFLTALLVLAVAMSSHETWTELCINGDESREEEEESCCFVWGVFANMFLPYGSLIAIAYISPWWIKFLIPTIYAAVFFFFSVRYFGDDNVLAGYLRESGDDVYDSRLPTLYVYYLCICSVLVSVVFTVGNTFFILQAIDLNPKLGLVPVAVVCLPIIKEATMKLMCVPCSIFPLGLISSMIFTTLCCITAAKVETRRLGVVVSEGVVDDSTTIISMSILWLVPQFVLLGLAEKSFDDHLQHGMEKVIRKTYVIGRIIKAAGFYGGVLSVYLVGILKPSWIQDTVNTSQLDNYYWFLATLSAVNLLLSGLIMVYTTLVLPTKDNKHSSRTKNLLTTGSNIESC